MASRWQRSGASRLDFALLNAGILVPPDVNLGAFIGDVYAEFWAQRFVDGIILHPSRVEYAGDLRDFSHSAFVLHAQTSAWFSHVRPPIEGVYDSSLFTAIAQASPRYASRLTDEEWPSKHGFSSAEGLALFSPHCESTQINLSGGFAVLIAQYDLWKKLGAPVERQFVYTGVLASYELGYLVYPAPPLVAHHKGRIVSEAGCWPEHEFMTSGYVLRRQGQTIDDTRQTTLKDAGGLAFEWGTWAHRSFRPPPMYPFFRPRRGFFAD